MSAMFIAEEEAREKDAPDQTYYAAIASLMKLDIATAITHANAV